MSEPHPIKLDSSEQLSSVWSQSADAVFFQTDESELLTVKISLIQKLKIFFYYLEMDFFIFYSFSPMEFVNHPLVMLCLKQSSLIYNHLSTYMQAAQIFEPIPAAQRIS